jgi:hypothetical protein
MASMILSFFMAVFVVIFGVVPLSLTAYAVTYHCLYVPLRRRMARPRGPAMWGDLFPARLTLKEWEDLADGELRAADPDLWEEIHPSLAGEARR